MSKDLYFLNFFTCKRVQLHRQAYFSGGKGARTSGNSHIFKHSLHRITRQQNRTLFDQHDIHEKKKPFQSCFSSAFFSRDFFLSPSLELFKFLKWKNAGIFILPTNYRHIQVVLKALLNSNLSPPSHIAWGATFL